MRPLSLFLLVACHGAAPSPDDSDGDSDAPWVDSDIAEPVDAWP